MIRIDDLFRALVQRWKMAALIGLGVFLLIAALAVIQPRRYQATSSLLVDVTQTDPTDKEGAPSQQAVDSIIGTQADVVRSSLVIRETVRRAGLVAANASPADISVASTALSRNLVVGTDRGSNVIRVSYLDTDAQRSARVVNTVADVFLQKQVELRTQPARTNANWYNARVAEVRRKLEAAQTRLSNFQRQRGIVGMNRMDLEADKVRNLSTVLVQAQDSAAEAHSRAGSAAMPEIARSAIVQDLQRESALQAAKVADLAKTLGPNHPQMVAERAQLAELQSSLAAARSSQAEAQAASSNAASRREAEVRGALVAQQARMLAVSNVQDELNVLERDVDAANQDYDAVRKRLNEASLKSEIPQANASWLDRASAPVLPAKPNLILWFMAAIVLGAVGGVVPILIMEAMNPRVRSASGTANATEVNVIMDLTQPASTSAPRMPAPTLAAVGA